MAEALSIPRAGEKLEPFEIEVTAERVRAYADAAHDHNPIHLDTAFAVTTPFGGTIAHGMLLLAYLSRLMTQRFGPAWVVGGTLDARLRAPAMVGSRVRVEGEITAVSLDGSAATVECRLQVSDAAGKPLVTATTRVSLPVAG